MMFVEAPAYSFDRLKSVVVRRRAIKSVGKDTDLRGGRGTTLEGILSTAYEVVSALRSEHGAWIAEKLAVLAPYLETTSNNEDLKSNKKSPRELLEDTYRAGLTTTLTQEYRVAKNSLHDEVDTLQDPSRIADIVAGYTFEFYRSLHTSQRIGIDPGIALQLAQLSYRHNPNVLSRLRRKYPDVNPGVISSAALSYPTNPEGFLNSYITAVSRLKADPRYESLGESVVERAALHSPTNPEGFLNSYITAVSRLKADPRYESLGESVVKHAALHYPTNPEGFLNSYITAFSRLKADPRYGSLGDSVIHSAALHYSTNPEKFLDSYITALSRLKADPRYGSLGDSVIHSAALYYPTNPEGFLDRFLGL